MPFSPDEQSTDRLLKYLEIDLRQKFDTHDLALINWFMFRDHDRPPTLVTTKLAASAFIYLGFDASGSWRRNPKLLMAILAFLGRYYRIPAMGHDLARLKQIIDGARLDRQAIMGWFISVYPPDPASPP